MRVQFTHSYHRIISTDNLLTAWHDFRRGKRKKKDVQLYELHLTNNILSLHHDLATKQYQHGPYQGFHITDPKPRHIHKASVRDRVLHHAIYRQLYPFFNTIFISDSFSCRNNKGTHRAMRRFQQAAWRVSRNSTRTCWILKCDIKKFFASIDQTILRGILETYISDQDILWLLNQIIKSFHSTKQGKGLPLGNLTSQLLVNVYMNEFDHHIKHRLKAKHYIRYADDFVLLSPDKDWLIDQVPRIQVTLNSLLGLELHPNKVSISTVASGIDWLGWRQFTDHRILRTTTKRRMMKKMNNNPSAQSLQSYVGLMKHGNAQILTKQLNELIGNVKA